MIEAIIGILKKININYLMLSIALVVLFLSIIRDDIPLWMIIVGAVCGVYFIIVQIEDYKIKRDNDRFEKQEKIEKEKRIEEERKYKERLIETFFNGCNKETKDLFAKVTTLGNQDLYYENIRHINKSDSQSYFLCHQASHKSEISVDYWIDCSLITIDDIGNDCYRVKIDKRLYDIIEKYKQIGI